MKLIQGDCLEEMAKLEAGSVDMVLTDPPYGTTACKWDSVIPLKPMWEQLKRVIKPNGAIVLNAAQPFTSTLVNSNLKMWRHNWQWNKNNSAGFATAKIRPMQVVEDICVFGLNKVNYYPQMVERGKPRKKGGYRASDNYGITPTVSTNNLYYPKSLIDISNASQKGKVHPTQKPIDLMEYLIKTYTLENETVLDFTMGSGTTGVACANLGRNFVGIELDEEYFNMAKRRIEDANEMQLCLTPNAL